MTRPLGATLRCAFVVMAAAVALAGPLPASAGSDRAPGPPPGPPEATLTVGLQQVRVEVADTAARRSRGLSRRASLAPGRGMYFPYEVPARPGFWMKDMRFDIDIVWLRDGHITGIEASVSHELGTPRPRPAGDAGGRRAGGARRHRRALGLDGGDPGPRRGLATRRVKPGAEPAEGPCMADPTAMLFAPPLPPTRLDALFECVIGRHPDCAMTVPSAQASRRHAAVRLDGGRAFLRDLGSTNGTFHNGERVADERELAPGDRIEIGDTTLTFCRVDAAPEALNEGGGDQTIVAFRGDTPSDAGGALEGDLALVPVFAVLQMLELGGQTGCLTVQTSAGPERLWVTAGRVVHAEGEKGEGLDAALALATRDEGRFEFRPGEPPAEPSFEAGVTEIILEASRLLDEAEAEG